MCKDSIYVWALMVIVSLSYGDQKFIKLRKLKDLTSSHYLADYAVPLYDTLATNAIESIVNHADVVSTCIALKDICGTLRLKNGNFVQITVGIHCGNVIGTVIGAHRRFFGIFGDTVNTASRICTTGVKYKINISQKVHLHQDIDMKHINFPNHEKGHLSFSWSTFRFA
eukprot:234800_1